MKFLRFINGGGGIVYHSPGLWILAILEVETGKFEKSFIIKKKEEKLGEKVKGGFAPTNPYLFNAWSSLKTRPMV